MAVPFKIGGTQAMGKFYICDLLQQNPEQVAWAILRYTCTVGH